MPSEPFDGCNFTDTIKTNGRTFMYSVYCGFIPCFFVLAIAGRLISLLAFRVQAKTESAYMFQIFVAIADTVEAFAFSFYIATRYFLSGVSRWSKPWFIKCYICMFVDAHFSNTLQMGSMFWSVFLSLCMTLDRIYALGWPIKYNKNKNRKLQQWIIFAGSIILSILCTFFVGFYFNVWWSEEEQVYHNKVNTPWRPVLISLVQFHTSLIMGFTIALALANIALVAIFRYRMKERAKTLQNSDTAAAEMQKIRVLFWLTFMQSMLNMISAGSAFIYQIVSQICIFIGLSDDEIDCVSELMAGFVDGGRALAEMSDFYIVFALVPTFRKMVISALKHTFKFGSGSDKVHAISISGGSCSKSTYVVKRGSISTTNVKRGSI